MFWVHLFSSPEYAHFLDFGGTFVNLATSGCQSVNFCIVLCAVLALNSRAIKSEAWTTNSNPFSGSWVQIIFRLFSLRTNWNWKELTVKVPKQWRSKCFCSCRTTNLSPALFPNLLHTASIAPPLPGLAKNSKYSNFLKNTCLKKEKRKVYSYLYLSVNRMQVFGFTAKSSSSFCEITGNHELP